MTAVARARSSPRALVLQRFSAPAPSPRRLLQQRSQELRPFALLSGAGDPELSRWSYGGLQPAEQWGDFEAAHRAVVARHSGTPLDALSSSGAQDVLRSEPPRSDRGAVVDDGLPPFTGGVVGYLGYDFGWRFAGRPRPPRADPLGMPSARFFEYDAIYARDEWTGVGYVLVDGTAEAERRGRRLVRALTRPEAPIDGGLAGSLSARIGRAEHEARVVSALDAIQCGDVYQLNLTYPLEGLFTGDPAAALDRLAASAPPFAAYLQVDEDAHLVSASPECFLDVDRSGRIRTFPIKGTRKRAVGARDRSEARALRSDPKERAEHTMIVDLLRNDLGRICRPGSVTVEGLAYLESFSTVHHLTSRVQGFLRRDLCPGDLLRALYPGGSITGAPKLAAMELIDALEDEARGAYCGSLMWIDRGGAMRSSIAIRTAQIREGELRFGVGGGIVADSNPTREWEETQLKAQALGAALTG